MLFYLYLRVLWWDGDSGGRMVSTTLFVVAVFTMIVVVVLVMLVTTVLAMVMMLVTTALCNSRPWWREQGSCREKREDGWGPWSGRAVDVGITY